MKEAYRPVVLITGASSGIGSALCEEYAKKGYGVLMVARNKEKMEALAGQLQEKHGTPTYVFSYDLAKPGAIAQLMEEIKENSIQIEVLVNNAGLGVFGAYGETSWEEERQVLDVNIMATAELTHRILPSMLERKKGHIVNIGSLAGFQPGPMMPLYYASKAFILSFSQSLYEQLRKTGVKVTLVAPGPVETDFARRTGGAQGKKLGYKPVSAQRIAQLTVNSQQSGRVLIIPGASNRLLIILGKILPWWIVARIVKRGQLIMR